MEGPERGREHFNDAFWWLTFRPGRQVGARRRRDKQRVCRLQRDFKYRAVAAAARA
jgi:hypothetical protein